MGEPVLAGERASVARPAGPPHAAPMHGRLPCPEPRPEPVLNRCALDTAFRPGLAALLVGGLAACTALAPQRADAPATARIETPVETPDLAMPALFPAVQQMPVFDDQKT